MSFMQYYLQIGEQTSSCKQRICFAVDGFINKRLVKTFLSSLRRVPRPLIKITTGINRGEGGRRRAGNMNLSFFPRHVRGG